MRNSKVIDMLRVEHAAEIARKDERIRELEDRLMANNVVEFHAARHIAMPLATDEPEGVWLSDPTGLVREFVPRVADEG